MDCRMGYIVAIVADGHKFKMVYCGRAVQRTDYYPYGLPHSEINASLQPYKHSGKEFDTMLGLNTGDFHARAYAPDKIIFERPDILSGNTNHTSPYTYCAANPIIFIDLSGLHPFYSTTGDFLGVDNFGMQGSYIVMDKKNYRDDMSADVAWRNDERDDISAEVMLKIESHYSKLKYRPDYDGFVTWSEGIEWAKKHPYASKNPTPENKLYVDAGKIDFGCNSINDVKENCVLNLFNCCNIITSAVDADLLSSVYALGRINVEILDKELKRVKIVNNKAAVYDWNVGGDNMRQLFIKINNFIFNIDPEKHGFEVVYYGIGKLKR